MKPLLIVASLLLAFPLHGIVINDPVKQLAIVHSITNNIEVAQLIIVHCNTYKVSIPLALSVVYNESKFNPNCVSVNSNSMDIGLFQLNTKSYHKYTIKELKKIDINIKFGVSHLAGNLVRNNYNVNKALAAYNAGQSRVNKGNIPVSTKKYIDKVISTALEYERRFK